MNTQNYIIHDCIKNVKNNLEQYVHIERYIKKKKIKKNSDNIFVSLKNAF